MLKIGQIVMHKRAMPHLLVIKDVPKEHHFTSEDTYYCAHSGLYFTDYSTSKGDTHCGYARHKSLIPIDFNRK